MDAKQQESVGTVSLLSQASEEAGRAPPRALVSKSRLALRFSERKLLLVAADLFVLVGALAVRLIAYDQVLASPPDAMRLALWGSLLVVVWLVVGLLLDVYDLALAAHAMGSMWRAGGAALLTSGIYLVIPRLTPGLPTRRISLLAFPMLATAGVALWRGVYARVFVQPTFHQTALVVGAGWAGRALAQAVAETGSEGGNPYRGTGYRILGFIDDDPHKQGQEIEGIRVLGGREDLVRLVHMLQPDELVVAITAADRIHPDLFRAILACTEMGVPVTTMTDLYERITGRTPVEHAGRDLHVVLPLSRPSAHRLYMALVRAAEVCVSLGGCAFTAFLVPWVWLAHRLTAPGDLFYRQERVGKGGRTFQIVKFRSMIQDAEKGRGAVWASRDDDRITPVGRFLRRTRLDEVPQFWNVLKGDMGLIGPRPERPEFVRELARQIPFYGVRHAVKPGLTGWAQVMYRYGASVDDALIKLQYDLYYIKRQGLYLDLLILIKTLRVMLTMEGQ